MLTITSNECRVINHHEGQIALFAVVECVRSYKKKISVLHPMHLQQEFFFITVTEIHDNQTNFRNKEQVLANVLPTLSTLSGYHWTVYSMYQP